MPWLMEIYHPTFWRNLSKGGGEGGWRDIYMEGRGGRHEGERAVTRDY